MNTNSISGAAAGSSSFQVQRQDENKAPAESSAGATFSFDRSVKIVSSPPVSNVSAEVVSDAVEKALTRSDWVGGLFTRAFAISD